MSQEAVTQASQALRQVGILFEHAQQALTAARRNLAEWQALRSQSNHPAIHAATSQAESRVAQRQEALSTAGADRDRARHEFHLQNTILTAEGATQAHVNALNTIIAQHQRELAAREKEVASLTKLLAAYPDKQAEQRVLLGRVIKTVEGEVAQQRKAIDVRESQRSAADKLRVDLGSYRDVGLASQVISEQNTATNEVNSAVTGLTGRLAKRAEAIANAGPRANAGEKVAKADLDRHKYRGFAKEREEATARKARSRRPVRAGGAQERRPVRAGSPSTGDSQPAARPVHAGKAAARTTPGPSSPAHAAAEQRRGGRLNRQPGAAAAPEQRETPHSPTKKVAVVLDPKAERQRQLREPKPHQPPIQLRRSPS